MPVVERVACRMRAQVAGAAVAGGIIGIIWMTDDIDNLDDLNNLDYLNNDCDS